MSKKSVEKGRKLKRHEPNEDIRGREILMTAQAVIRRKYEKKKKKSGPTKVGMTYFIVNWHRWRSATKKSRMVNTNDSSLIE